MTGLSIKENDWKNAKLEFRGEKVYNFTLSETYGDQEYEDQEKIEPRGKDQSWLKWVIIAGIVLILIATVALLWVFKRKVNSDTDRQDQEEADNINKSLKNNEEYAGMISSDDMMREQDSRL